MAQRLNFSDYLITFEVVWDRNARRTFDNAIHRMKEIPLEMRKRLHNAASRGGSIVHFKVDTDISDKKWKQMARETEKLRNDLVSMGGAQSELAIRAEKAIDDIWSNVATRFVASNLDAITGQLANIMASQEPAVDESTNGGIRVGVANIRELNEGTQPYYLLAKGGYVHRGPSDKQYSYSTPAGEVDASGYWAYQEFGAAGPSPVRARHFLLAANRGLYGEDVSLFDSVLRYVTERSIQYVDNIDRIMS
jgi:hypothetical protein